MKRRKNMDYCFGEDLQKYIDEELFTSMYVCHPCYAVHGKIETNEMKQLKNNGTKLIVIPDRNIISMILTAVKKGTFDGGNKKKITAFLAWTIKNNFAICPYDSVRENFYSCGNIACNKEIELFNYLYDNVPIDVIIESFYNDGIFFDGKKFAETSSKELVNFQKDNADFNFLYAAILHFVYVLRTEKNPEKRFYTFFEWYLKGNICSVYIITYVLFFLEGNGTPPHNSFNDAMTIKGCMNEAFDLLYIQDLDPNRYPSEMYTVFFATQDIRLFKVFELVNDRAKYDNSKDKFLEVLFAGFSNKNRDKYLKFFKQLYYEHISNVNKENALVISKNLRENEETRLINILDKTREKDNFNNKTSGIRMIF